MISRRSFLLAGAGLGVTVLPAMRTLANPSGETPFESFDASMLQFMHERGIPGGALAVLKEGRLVHARGYGLADRRGKKEVTPKALFRIASLSKPITGLAICQLAVQGKLTLNDRVVRILDLDLKNLRHGTLDARWKEITIEHLLHHTAGWDSTKSSDPMFGSVRIARVLGIKRPIQASDIISYMLGEPLDFDPGSRYVYSNFGYCLLGRIIEKVSGQSYEKHVKTHLLEPAGIHSMCLGRSLLENRKSGEVHYYLKDEHATSNAAGEVPKRTPFQYGGFCIETMDAHGGWLASVVDLARLTAHLDRPEMNSPYTPEVRALIQQIPPPPVWRDKDGALADAYYGAGWMVRPKKGTAQASYWHTGSLPGAFSLWVRRWDGISWIACFNQRSDDDRYPNEAIDLVLNKAADQVKSWPAHDLFPDFR